jgi:hypothetical protein
MKQYDLTVKVQEHGMSKIETKTSKVILSDKDNVKEFAQMMYGCWYDVLRVDYEECDEIHISKTYLIEQAYKMIHFT